MEKIETNQKSSGISGNTLKLIALISMTIDHIGSVLVEIFGLNFFLFLRALGRLAFPLYCFLLVEGAHYTHNRKKYLLRLLAFALISDLPFCSLFYGKGHLSYRFGENIFWTLLLGLLLIFAVEKIRKNGYKFPFLLELPSAMCFGLIAYMFGTDYGFLGGLLIYSLYIMRDNRNRNIWVLFPISVCLLMSITAPMELFCLPSFFLMFRYNGERGKKIFGKYFFYAYYPLHLTILFCIVLICFIIGGS